MQKLVFRAFSLALAFVAFASQASAADLTASVGCVATAQGENLGNPPYIEGAAEGLDGDSQTKWLDFANTSWLQCEFVDGNAYVVDQYALTSGNDFPTRDPQDWVLQGSNDGVNFVDIDSRSGQTFASRFLTQTYTATNTTAYRFYRLNVTANSGDWITQLSELQLTGPGGGTPPPPPPTPTAPGTVTNLAAVAGDTVVDLTWTAPANNGGAAITDYIVESSPAGGQFTVYADGISTSTSATVSGLTNGLTYDFRVQAVNSVGNSVYSAVVSASPVAPPPPPTPGNGNDVTDNNNCVITVSGDNAQFGEAGPQLIDNDHQTKWLDFFNIAWFQCEFADGNAYVIDEYTLTSANDFPTRDPRDWTLQGSNDGVNFVDVDTRSGQTFPNRFTTQTYTASNTTAYRMYRLDITANNGDWLTQLAELELISNGGTTPPPAPTAPDTVSNLAAVAGDTVVDLTWTAPADDGGAALTDYLVESRPVGGQFTVYTDGVSTSTNATVSGLTNGTTYEFRVQAVNSVGNSVYSSVVTATPTGTTPPPNPSPLVYSGGLSGNASCPTFPTIPGRYTVNIDSGSHPAYNMRSFVIDIPGVTNNVPVIFSWHWLGGQPNDTLDWLGLSGVPDDKFLVSPVSTLSTVPGDPTYRADFPYEWFTGNPDVDGTGSNPDIVLYQDILACLDQQFNVDLNRVHIASHSAGAAWTSFMAMHASDHIASAVIMSGGLQRRSQWVSPASNMSLLLVWGGPNDAFNPNQGPIYPSPDWYNQNGDPNVYSFHEASLDYAARMRTDGNFVVTCEGTFDHQIPPPGQSPGGNVINYIWPFLQAHPKDVTNSPYSNLANTNLTGIPSVTCANN